MSQQDQDGGKKGRRASNAGQKELSGKKQSSADGKDARPTRKREETTGLHRSETESSAQTKQKIDSGKRTSGGRMDKP